MKRVRSPVALALLATGASLTYGCVPVRPTPVSPSEIPALEESLARNPQDGEARLRYAAALFAQGRCNEAMAEAETGRALLPDDPLGPLVIGACLERAERLEEAIRVYAAFLSEHRGARGAAAVEARRELAFREQARRLAQRALEYEDSLAALPPDPEAVAVLPLFVDGADQYQPLSVGLSHMMITDLASLGRFRLVERVQLHALLQEMELGAQERVQPGTAARAGRLLRAARVVQGSVAIPSEREARLEGTLVLSSGEVVEPFATSGAFQDLMQMEKEMVVQVAGALGYQLSAAERQRILERGTRNLMAFLAFSRGLMAEDRGDFDAATTFYAEAVAQDPTFSEALARRDAAAVAGIVAGAPASELTTVPARAEEAVASTAAEPGAALLGNALSNSVLDIASLQSERATQGAGMGDASRELSQLTSTANGIPPSRVEAIIRIILRIAG